MALLPHSKERSELRRQNKKKRTASAVLIGEDLAWKRKFSRKERKDHKENQRVSRIPCFIHRVKGL
jgi:ribosomal protein L4